MGHITTSVRRYCSRVANPSATFESTYGTHEVLPPSRSLGGRIQLVAEDGENPYFTEVMLLTEFDPVRQRRYALLACRRELETLFTLFVLPGCAFRAVSEP
jgi:hypothetical protein